MTIPTKREANRTRNNALEMLKTPANVEAARAAWARAWDRRREGVTINDQRRARFVMLQALADGKPLDECERIAGDELAREAV